MEFKDRLKELRKEKNLTQIKLGEMLNYGYTAIANYESGRNQPSISDLKKIASIFNVSLDYLIGVSDIRYPYVLDDKSAEFIELRRRYSLLNEEGREMLFDYLDYLESRTPRSQPQLQYAETTLKPLVLRASQKPEEYKKD